MQRQVCLPPVRLKCHDVIGFEICDDKRASADWIKVFFAAFRRFRTCAIRELSGLKHWHLRANEGAIWERFSDREVDFYGAIINGLDRADIGKIRKLLAATFRVETVFCRELDILCGHWRTVRPYKALFQHPGNGP